MNEPSFLFCLGLPPGLLGAHLILDPAIAFDLEKLGALGFHPDACRGQGGFSLVDIVVFYGAPCIFGS